MRYNVLWIDDEYKKLTSVISDAEMDDIILTPYSTSKEGIKAFKEDIYKWDAVILDAKGWNESSDEVATTEGMHNSLDKIAELRYKRIVPVFIFSGQGDLYDDGEFKRALRGRKLYKKGNKTDQAQLFQDIKTEADKLVETQIRFKYADVVEIFPDIMYELINIIKRVYNNITDDKEVFTPIRKILEWVMEYCNKSGVLPIPFKGTNLAECSQFMGKKEMQEYVPVHVQRSFHSCVDIANNGSHRLAIDTIVGSGSAPYLIRSTVFELLNIIYWCKNLPTDRNRIEDLKKNTSALISTETSVEIRGLIEQDENRNYHCEDYLLNYKEIHPDDIGKRIKIIKYSPNTSERTKELYHFFVTRRDFEFLEDECSSAAQ